MIFPLFLIRMQGYRKLEAAQIVARVENCTQDRKPSSAPEIKHNEILRMRKIHANGEVLGQPVVLKRNLPQT